MTTVSDLNTVLSGHNHIDALLDDGPDWNYLTAGGNTITYTFSTASGNETFSTSNPSHFTGGLETMSAAQQAGVRTAFAYLSKVTGIVFQETSDGNAASLHLVNADLNGSSVTGLFSYTAPIWYMPNTNELTSYAVDGYLYLDNAEWASRNYSLNEGGSGYETLLHELGHALGLKHPFEGAIQLPDNEDSSQYTLMSYDNLGGPYARFSSYDLAALNWLYGGDGLGGALGIGSASGARYITGSARSEQLTGTDAADVLQGLGGDDKIYGGAGNDTVLFTGASTDYTFASATGGALQATGLEGTDLLYSVEVMKFDNGSFSRAQLLETTTPPAPSVSVSLNRVGYVSGNTPLFAGTTEANATVRLYSGQDLIGVTVADDTGLWYTNTGTLGDGQHLITASATSTAGKVSPLSSATTILVDAHAPSTPTVTATLAAGGNQPLFNGSGEAGTVIKLIDTVGTVNTMVGETVVTSAGTWTLANPMLNGSYNLTVQSLDAADNLSNAAGTVKLTVASSLNRTLTDGKDLFINPAGNNAIDGGAGTDTVVYGGARANYVVEKAANGFTVRSASGELDTVVNVERLRFDDVSVALDIEGFGGQAYRLYQAAFDRTPLLRGVGFWMDGLDNGVTLDHVAAQFVSSPEFVGKFGAQDNSDFIRTLFEHVLHRQPKEAGFNFWVSALDNGVSRAHVLAQFSESAENKLNVIGRIEDGLDYLLWQG